MAMKASTVYLLLLLGQPAHAERWRYAADALAGRAEVVNPAGNRLSVTCGNSGEVGLQLVPPPPLEQAARGGSVALRFVIDGDLRNAFDVPMSCRKVTSCDTGGAPGFRDVVSALEGGRWVEVWSGGTGLDAFALDGS